MYSSESKNIITTRFVQRRRGISVVLTKGFFTFMSLGLIMRGPCVPQSLVFCDGSFKSNYTSNMFSYLNANSGLNNTLGEKIILPKNTPTLAKIICFHV